MDHSIRSSKSSTTAFIRFACVIHEMFIMDAPICLPTLGHVLLFCRLWCRAYDLSSLQFLFYRLWLPFSHAVYWFPIPLFVWSISSSLHIQWISFSFILLRGSLVSLLGCLLCSVLLRVGHDWATELTELTDGLALQLRCDHCTPTSFLCFSGRHTQLFLFQ